MAESEHVTAMAHPVTGVALKSRKVLRPLAMGYKLYKDCFSGTDGVSWVAVQCRESRGQAVARLQGWLDAGLLKRVGQQGPFEDDRNTYFQFQGGRSAASARAGGPVAAATASSAAAVPALLPGAALPGVTVLAAAAVSVARGRKRARPGHFLALCAAGPAQLSLQLGKAVSEGGSFRVSNVWPLRAVVAMDTEAGATFVVRLRREGGSALEYRFEAATAAARDDFMGSVLTAASQQMRYTPKSNFDWERRNKEAKVAASESESQPSVSLETLEAASQSEEDVSCQALLWEVMEEHRLSAAAAGEYLERTLQETQRRNASALADLDRDLVKAYERTGGLTEAARHVEQALVAQLPLVQEGESHIRAIRGHEAQRERSQRHLNNLISVLQLLMASLSVPPRYLSLLREPIFSQHDLNDMVAALRAVDKVVTLKDLDQRLLRMRAVSDRAQEYRALMAGFADSLSAHVASLLRERAALRPPQAGSAPPPPFHTHIKPYTLLYTALPRPVTAALLDLYMDVAKQVYKSDLPAYFAGLLSTVRRSKELTILEAFHLALQAVWGLVQAELEFWSNLGDDGAATAAAAAADAAAPAMSSSQALPLSRSLAASSGRVQLGGGDVEASAVAAPKVAADGGSLLVQRLGDTFVELAEELASFLEYADRHSTLDVIGMMVEAAGWRSAGEPMQSLSAIVAISSRLTSVAQRHLQKIAEQAINFLRESHMSRGKTGALTSFQRLPPFLDNIHSYGIGSRSVTQELVDKVVPALLEWLESPEVVKELIKFDSSKMTIFAGRLENYHFLFTELAARVAQVGYLESYANTCRERFERNLAAFVSFIFEREFHSLFEYFGAIAKMQRTVPAEEIQFQVSLSRGAFGALNRKYNEAAWQKKVAHIRKLVGKNIAAPLQPHVFDAIKSFTLERMREYQSTLLACYGPTTVFNVANVEVFFCVI